MAGATPIFLAFNELPEHSWYEGRVLPRFSVAASIGFSAGGEGRRDLGESGEGGTGGGGGEGGGGGGGGGSGGGGG
eukprot:5948047-Pleurochrysis_carterae.AAC.1